MQGSFDTLECFLALSLAVKSSRLVEPGDGVPWIDGQRPLVAFGRFVFLAGAIENNSLGRPGIHHTRIQRARLVQALECVVVTIQPDIGNGLVQIRRGVVRIRCDRLIEANHRLFTLPELIERVPFVVEDRCRVRMEGERVIIATKGFRILIERRQAHSLVR